MKYCCAALLVLGLGCDEKAKMTPDAAPEAGVAAVTSQAPPPPPTPPVLTLDDKALTVNGNRTELTGGDITGRLAAMLGNTPLVSSYTVEVDALRDVSMPHMAVALDALRAAHAKGVTLKTAQRDLTTMGTLDMTFDHGPLPPCSAVATVGAKDNAIYVWSASGAAPAQRFSHGFAGPDITLGSAALRKVANACESPVYYVSGEDGIKWGVVFDLALAAKTGATFRPTSVVVLTKPPVPGRKLE